MIVKFYSVWSFICLVWFMVSVRETSKGHRLGIFASGIVTLVTLPFQLLRHCICMLDMYDNSLKFGFNWKLWRKKALCVVSIFIIVLVTLALLRVPSILITIIFLISYTKMTRGFIFNLLSTMPKLWPVAILLTIVLYVKLIAQYI